METGLSAKNKRERGFPGGPVVKTELPNQGAQVSSLVGEIRSRMRHGKKDCTKQHQDPEYGMAWPKRHGQNRLKFSPCDYLYKGGLPRWC